MMPILEGFFLIISQIHYMTHNSLLCNVKVKFCNELEIPRSYMVFALTVKSTMYSSSFIVNLSRCASIVFQDLKHIYGRYINPLAEAERNMYVNRKPEDTTVSY